MYHVTEIGGGVVQTAGEGFHLSIPPTPADRYADAQISSYRTRADFTCQPPLRMTIRAWMPDGMAVGTAGFGFWNHPFVPGERGFRLPQAVWFFFGSPPNEMRLALDVPGAGWKCATIDATRPAFLALLPTAPLGFLLMRIPPLYRRLWPLAQRALGVSEHALDPALLREPHTYTLEWLPGKAVFSVDGRVVHRAQAAPRGLLGFIAWIDNQYAVVTAQGRFGFGLVEVAQTQTLVIEQVRVEPGRVLVDSR
jgi:hypothetical protein